MRCQGRHLFGLLLFGFLSACSQPMDSGAEEKQLLKSSVFVTDEVIPPVVDPVIPPVIDPVIPPVVDPVPPTPEVPTTPTEPETPATPEVPTQPEIPTVPETPTPPVVVDPTPPTTPTEPEVPSTPEVPTVPEVPETPQLTTCEHSALKLKSLANIINTAGGQAGYNNKIKANCLTSIEGFDATTTDKHGVIKNHTAAKLKSTARSIPVILGVNCSTNNNKTISNLFVKGFGASKIRGDNKIMKTAICKTGSAAPCTMATDGFIAELNWIGDKVQSVTLNSEAQITTEELSCQAGVKLESPLIIEDRKGAGVSMLNPYTTNTYFDIKGDGIQHRISCVKYGSFLVLPDAQGRVTNIDQLFGNNTMGPDNKKSENGFIALGKHDSNNDGVIDRSDKVFASLKLWKDVNCDGVAQAHELSPLSSNQITTIKWNPATDMYQEDKWGNVTMQRSTVRQSSGQMLRIFDVWFKLY